MQQIRALVVCAMGFTSSLVEENLKEAAQNKGVDIELKSAGTSGVEDVVKSFSPDVILVAPQSSYIRRRLEAISQARGIKLLLMEHFAYATADGDAILKTILAALGQ